MLLTCHCISLPLHPRHSFIAMREPMRLHCNVLRQRLRVEDCAAVSLIVHTTTNSVSGTAVVIISGRFDT